MKIDFKNLFLNIVDSEKRSWCMLYGRINQVFRHLKMKKS